MMDYIFRISVEDVQSIALRRIGRELCLEELEQVQRGVEFGLELSWMDVVQDAIDEIISDKKFQRRCKKRNKL
jgi:hypothetical protein